MDVHASLARMLSPSTLAVVGANEQLGMSNNAVLPMIESGRHVALVSPRRDVLYGQPVFADLTAIGEPVDAILSLVNAERSLDAGVGAAWLDAGCCADPVPVLDGAPDAECGIVGCDEAQCVVVRCEDPYDGSANDPLAYEGAVGEAPA